VRCDSCGMSPVCGALRCLCCALRVLCRHVTSTNASHAALASAPYCVHVTPSTFIALLDMLALATTMCVPSPGTPVANLPCFSTQAKTDNPM